MARPWFRMYRKTVNNPKVQRLRPELFRAWVNILCATDDDGNVPELNGLAFTLRVGEAVARKWVCQLVDARLLASDGLIVTAHDWTEHNYDSDCDPTARDRKRKSRSMSRVTSEPSRANVTRTEQIQTQDTEQKDKPTGLSGRKNGTRWPENQSVPSEWVAEFLVGPHGIGWSTDALRREAVKFENFWTAKTGSAATKLNWKRMFENWCLNAKGQPNGKGQPGAIARIAAKVHAARAEQAGRADIREA